MIFDKVQSIMGRRSPVPTEGNRPEQLRETAVPTGCVLLLTQPSEEASPGVAEFPGAHVHIPGTERKICPYPEYCFSLLETDNVHILPFTC